MPPLAHYANTQTGQNDINYSGGYGSDSSSSYSGGSQYDTVQGAQTQAASYQKIMDEINAKISQLQGSLNSINDEQSKFERDKLKAQYDDAQKGRDNAYEIAKLNGANQRYGYDQQRQTEIDKLKQDQNQYDQTHALDLKKYGLEVAKAYTSYASTPDQVWALNDFKSALSNVGQGLTPQSSATEPTAHAKTWQDFAALSGYDTTGDTTTGSTSTGTNSSGGTTYTASGSGTDGSGYTAADTASGGTSSTGDSSGGTDQRQTAISAVVKAMPASESQGHDDQDWAALNAIKSLYFAGKPGSVERLGAARRKTAQSGLARAGYDPNLVEEDYTKAGVGQGAARAA